ncbi:MAG: DUF2269 family protein [Deltaproteobacteria bacterium]|jgi:uncharacterized membrane protein|nr:DUF2269 family protein [Deltaproteobacteria bacterium]
MIKFGKNGGRILKSIHLITVCLWVGGSMALNLLMLFPLEPKSGNQLYGYLTALRFIDELVIVPGALGSLITGLLMSLTTHWGFFKHRWLAVKWILTIACIVIGIVALAPPIVTLGQLASEEGLSALTNPSFIHAKLLTIKGGLALLTLIIFMTVISVFKPWSRKPAS